MANLEVTLKKATVTKAKNGLGILAYPIYVEAYSNINLENDESIQTNEEGLYPCNIFVYQKNGTGLDPNQGDRFMKVATALDIDGLPNYKVKFDDALEPITSIKGFPFFRYNKLKLLVDTADQVDDVWTYIQEDVNFLENDYNRFQNLTIG